jgi:hypothetical protein
LKFAEQTMGLSAMWSSCTKTWFFYEFLLVYCNEMGD